jgi:hypothetical protein
MAWPLTPLTTYLPGSLPAVKAADLNAIQAAINRGFLGTYSFAGLVVDGTGGQDATPTPGGIKTSGGIIAGGPITVGASAFGKSLPTPAPIAGAIYQDTRIIAAGFFYATAALAYGFNISAVARTPNVPVGSYLVTLILGSTVGTLVPVASVIAAISGASAQTVMQTNNSIRVDVTNAQGFVDEPFNLIVVGGG